MCRTRVLCGIVMLVDEVDTEEMQDQATKNVVGECSVLKSATCLIIVLVNHWAFHYLSGEIDSNSALFSAFVCILSEAIHCVRCIQQPEPET